MRNANFVLNFEKCLLVRYEVSTKIVSVSGKGMGYYQSTRLDSMLKFVFVPQEAIFIPKRFILYILFLLTKFVDFMFCISFNFLFYLRLFLLSFHLHFLSPNLLNLLF